MKLRNVMIVVKDIEVSKKFYKDLFGLDVVLDRDGNVILTEGLVLQDKGVWESAIGRETSQRGHDMELYFTEKNIHGFLKKLEESSYEIQYSNRELSQCLGQRWVRIYDPDGHLIEVGEQL